MNTHITFVSFTAFNQTHTISYEDNQPVMLYNIKRRVRIICPTSRIASIRHYEARLLCEEKINDKNNGDSGSQPVQPIKPKTT